ncbi:MAG: primosomal protein N', partial [Alphaproteobacteria bacterium]|nr:primosomal protein N' [Alphaproteobacteria bacterium]
MLLPLPLDRAYDYRRPPDLAPNFGDFVVVPLGHRDVVGVVWGPAAGDVDEAKLKSIAERLDAPPLPESIRRFVDWVAHYALAPPGSVLRMAMSVPAALSAPAPRLAYRRAPGSAEILADRQGFRLTDGRRRVLEVLADGPPRVAIDIAREAGVGSGVVKSLIAAGALLAVELPARPPLAEPDLSRPSLPLSDLQRAAADALKSKIREG